MPIRLLEPSSLSPSQSLSTISGTPSSLATTSSITCDSTTPTKLLPSSRTHSPRGRVCTPNKLTPSFHSQPTLAMSIIAPSPRIPQQQGSSSRTQRAHSPPPRPSSRSERLLRDTLRKDNTLRTTVTSRARSRSRSTCSDCDDDNFFQPVLIFQPSDSRRNSAASTRNFKSKSFYVPNENEDSSYAQLLRSSSDLDAKGYPIAPIQQEKLDECLSTSLPRSYVIGSDAAPHEAVLRSRLERVLQNGMREEERRIKRSPDEESSSASPPSSARSLSNSYTHSQSSEKPHVTAHAVEPLILPSISSKHGRKHRYSQTTSVPYSQKSPQSQGEISPWMTTPLPPSPFSTPTKKSPSSPYATPSPHSPNPAILSGFSSANPHIPVNPPQFDLRAASQACKQASGYVSFASVAGLGAPPGMGDDEVSIKEPQRGRRRGRWWVF
ncbi:uncharacterized protein F5891DRAFT_1026511 [Suillus fuscotomentosus]|uniref:Uncharacterized protein n=1 Tax=Suillus fuscotomentosus TaxID=1912939 RepID=A0AAD4HMK6_9AGAM|nr:uncharacterized protein F5891DRAFT_1026511 [Suillus fuscotomentosus]KAG1901962.1 hypothetical protein F5891DRAFT_1026511 [Suillus fuscotomentosus]